MTECINTFSFTSEVLATEVFTDVLISCGCLIWAVNVNSEEGTRVSFVLRETSYPFMAIIMLKGSRMTVIGRLEGQNYKQLNSSYVHYI